MIKAVIFDLGNVIVNVNYELMFRRFASKSSKSKEFIESYYNNSQTRKSFEMGKVNDLELYKKMTKDLDIKINFSQFKKAYTNIFSLKHDVAELIKKLKSNYRLILLSNTGKLHFEYIKKNYKILNVFDEYVLSYKVGCSKPNPLIFLEAIKKAKTMPFNCLYFDDIREFVLVARLMGIKAYQFKNYGKLIDDLAKNKISAKPL